MCVVSPYTLVTVQKRYASSMD